MIEKVLTSAEVHMALIEHRNFWSLRTQSESTRIEKQ